MVRHGIARFSHPRCRLCFESHFVRPVVFAQLGIEFDAMRSPDLAFDFTRDVGIFLQEGLGVFPAPCPIRSSP